MALDWFQVDTHSTPWHHHVHPVRTAAERVWCSCQLHFRSTDSCSSCSCSRSSCTPGAPKGVCPTTHSVPVGPFVSHTRTRCRRSTWAPCLRLSAQWCPQRTPPPSGVARYEVHSRGFAMRCRPLLFGDCMARASFCKCFFAQAHTYKCFTLDCNRVARAPLWHCVSMVWCNAAG